MRLVSLASIGLLTLAACDTFSAPDPELAVNTTVKPNHGGPNRFEIRVYVTNESRRAIELNAGNCPRRFRVENESGSEIALPPQDCDLLLTVRTLVPGDAHTFTGVWDGTNAAGAQLVGRYRIIGQVYPSGPRGNAVTVDLH